MTVSLHSLFTASNTDSDFQKQRDLVRDAVNSNYYAAEALKKYETGKAEPQATPSRTGASLGVRLPGRR